MSDIKSLVRVDRQLVVTAVENYDKKINQLEKEAEEGIAQWKDDYKFSWWDKFRGRDKWDSEKLFYYAREKSGYWTSMYQDLYRHKLISQEAMTTYLMRDHHSRDFLDSVLYSGSAEVYLDNKCLSFVRNNT